MKNPELQRLDIGCDCGDLNHRVVIEYCDDDPTFLSIHTMLNNSKPWWKRWILAFKYAFGMDGSKDWYYVDVVVGDIERDELQKFLDQQIQDVDAYMAALRDPKLTYTPIRGYSLRGH